MAKPYRLDIDNYVLISVEEDNDTVYLSIEDPDNMSSVNIDDWDAVKLCTEILKRTSAFETTGVSIVSPESSVQVGCSWLEDALELHEKEQEKAKEDPRIRAWLGRGGLGVDHYRVITDEDRALFRAEEKFWKEMNANG